MIKSFGKRKMHRAWSMYDWANSVYNLVITSTIFPMYYIAVTRDQNDATIDYISLFGFKFVNTSALNYALALAYLLVAFLSPILSSIADYRGTKKRFMKVFTYLGGGACCGMFFFDGAHITLGLLFAMIAALGYSGSQVFYNAYLPEIAEEKEHDRLSAKGFSFGYVGSVILQLICLAIVSISFDDPTFGARLSFLLVGVWWIGFAQIPFRVLPKGTPIGKDPKHSILYNGFFELKKVYGELKSLSALRIYLLAFFFYSMGVMTVMLVAAEFAVKEIKMEVDGQWVNLGETQLITSILLIQLVAIAGAILMARLSDKIGNISVLMITVGIWIGICVFGYYTYTANQFYVLAACVGLVMGGIQSMSRSTYSKMMPVTKDTASFFSFYNVAEKLAMALGLFFFGMIEDVTGSMRNSVFTLGIFFLIGLVFLFVTRRKVTAHARA